MQFQNEISISASAEKVFSIYTDVSGWSSWDPEVRASSIVGPFQTGASGTLKPTKGPEAKIAITDVVSNHSFTVESRLPLCIIRFEHVLTPGAKGTRALHRVSFHGFLAPLFGRLIGGQIGRSLPQTLLGLKHAAEN